MFVPHPDLPGQCQVARTKTGSGHDDLKWKTLRTRLGSWCDFQRCDRHIQYLPQKSLLLARTWLIWRHSIRPVDQRRWNHCSIFMGRGAVGHICDKHIDSNTRNRFLVGTDDQGRYGYSGQYFTVPDNVEFGTVAHRPNIWLLRHHSRYT